MLFLRFEKENQIRFLVYFECFYSMSILFQFILPWLSNLRIFPFGKLEFKDHTYTYTITYMHNICTKGTIHIRKKFGKGLVENMSCHGMYGIFSSITWEISVFERYWTFFFEYLYKVSLHLWSYNKNFRTILSCGGELKPWMFVQVVHQNAIFFAILSRTDSSNHAKHRKFHRGIQTQFKVTKSSGFDKI